MGSVWRAERLGWQAPVAIKVMNPADADDARARDRFVREARLVASLRSVHVVQVLDDGVDDESGLPFMVMELLEGETLAERLHRVKRLKAPIVAQIISQIARALARAHDAGMVHRDLKPDNILIVRNDDEEVIKVLDFGIAKSLDAPQKLAHRTHSGHMLGTPAYMSPEQFTNSAAIDHRADLWSLGVIACECLTGARPFEGDNLVRLAINVCSGRAPLPSSLGQVPDGFDAWFSRALARNPDERFPSARIMAEELRGLFGQIPILWEPRAVAPHEHVTRERTELEPVLELTRRARREGVGVEWPDPSQDSVEPVSRTRNASGRRRSRLWLGVAGLLIATGGLVALSPRLQSRSIEVTSNLLRNMASPRATPDPAPQGNATGAPAPSPTDPALSPPASSALPAQIAPGASDASIARADAATDSGSGSLHKATGLP
jgi:serine/threonine protein kinase